MLIDLNNKFSFQVFWWFIIDVLIICFIKVVIISCYLVFSWINLCLKNPKKVCSSLPFLFIIYLKLVEGNTGISRVCSVLP